MANKKENLLPTVEELLGILALSIDSHKVNLSQYTFLTDEKHKSIKSNLVQERFDDVEKKFKELEEYLYTAFGEVFDEQMLYLRDIFKNRSSFFVRACIKIIVKQDTIVTLYSSPESSQYDPFKFSDNTAFSEILDKNVDYYVCNDIPKNSKAGIYINNRIDVNKLSLATEVENQNVDDGHDELWASFWKCDSFDPGIFSSVYKSTLVIPMFLTTDELDAKFREHLFINDESKRAIFSFLCLDHPSKNFFNLETDVKITRIFADMLSLYLIHQFNITQYSSRYMEALKKINITENSAD
jgi:hypothetical protein